MDPTETVQALVDTYLAAWNETDATRRRALVSRTFTDDATYVDPLVAAETADGIDATIAAVQQHYPGHRFALADGPDAHHDRVRFSWHLVSEESGGRVATGTDVGELAPDGRLRAVTGFLEPVAT